jgi:hypothetical protein
MKSNEQKGQGVGYIKIGQKREFMVYCFSRILQNKKYGSFWHSAKASGAKFEGRQWHFLIAQHLERGG